MSDVLLLDRVGGVATVTMNRPESMNSLSVELKTALLTAFSQLSADPAVRAVVLTGRGRAFCVGQDLSEHSQLLQADDPTPLQTVREHYNPITLALAQMPKPLIAAVNGIDAGAGASLSFACDFRIVSEDAKFLLAFANVGLGLDSGASWTLPRLIGDGRALELSLLAEPITAKVANDYGLVTRLVPPSDVLGAAAALASRLASGPTTAYAAIKKAIGFAASHTLAESLKNEAAQQAVAGASRGHRTAVTAFVDKSRPNFIGR